MANSSESFVPDQVDREYFMQKIQWNNLGIVNRPTFLVKIWCFITPGGPRGAENGPLVVRYWSEHQILTHGNPKSWYQQPTDLSEEVQKHLGKAPSQEGWFWGFFEKTDYIGPYVPPVSRYGPGVFEVIFWPRFALHFGLWEPSAILRHNWDIWKKRVFH